MLIKNPSNFSHRIQLVQGILNPQQHFKNYSESRMITGFVLHVVLLLLASAAIHALSGYIIATTHANDLSGTTDANIGKELVVYGSVIFGALGGVFIPLINMTVLSFILWIFFRNHSSYKQLFVVHIYTTAITLIAMIVQITFLLLFESGQLGNFFGLGLLIRLVTDNTFFNHLFMNLTLFSIWQIIVQMVALRRTNSSSIYTYCVIMALNVGLTLVNTMISIWNGSQSSM